MPHRENHPRLNAKEDKEKKKRRQRGPSGIWISQRVMRNRRRILVEAKFH